MVRQVKNLNLQELFVEYLKGMGFIQNMEKTTRKYICMEKPNHEDRLFLGGSGAVRRGRSVSDSLSITHKFHDPQALDRIRAKVQSFRDAQKAQK